MKTEPFDPRVTEQRNPRTSEIDLADALGIVDLLNAEDQRVAHVVAGQRTAIASAVELAEQALRSGGRLIYVGAGTSGRLGVLDAAECPPTFGIPPGRVVGVIAGGNQALTTAVEGAEDDGKAGADTMSEIAVGSADLVVGIAASGTTPFVRGALVRARELGASTALLVCTPPDEEILRSVDVAIVLIVGPEAVTGSTRMKAGTATKLVLNTISTGAMIRLGKTYGNLMVDLKATNAKLSDRAQRIVMELCGVDRTGAAGLLDSAGGSVKIAIVMHTLGLGAADARARLDAVGGVIRRLLQPGNGSVSAGSE